MTVRDPENPYAGQGSVLLDIGGEIGALVVRMPASTRGMEVEARPSEGRASTGHHHHPHVAVVERPVEDGVVPSLVFPELSQGGYELGEKGTERIALTVQIRGGQVTSADWPG